ncbi:MAG: hypothetical protein P0Y58_22810 [Candidatus Pseudomonas phytovorans]|uniref:Uncharacterized protein n=1 Tax=Candidatus Pseudomonas phytovorans TaxID=3121377 RepID=A0AAJ5WHC1_9PSED|nr:hypothetical protein [Pseudomonas sp.]WEK29698.1 MAG: hypothetical protein P0Y58_22810 [Pseudomonas sp.]
MNTEGVSESNTSMVASAWSTLSPLNALWGALRGSLEFVVVTTPIMENYWESHVTRFGKAELVRTGVRYTEIYLSQGDEAVIRLRRLGGSGAKQVVAVGAPSPFGDRLRVSVDTDASWLKYDATADGELSMQWTGGASYAFYSPASSRTPAVVPDKFVAHYDQLKKVAITRVPPPQTELPQQIYINVVVQEVEGWPIVFIIKTQLSMSAQSSVASLQGCTYTPQTNEVLSAIPASEFFSDSADGKAPADLQWLSDLLVPPGSLTVTQEKKSAGSWLIQYGQRSRALVGATQESAVSAAYQLTPVARILAAGGSKELVEFTGTPLPNPTWALKGDERGQLEKENNRYFYVPPLSPQPSAKFNDSADMLISPAYRSAVDGLPVATDIVEATGASGSASSVFVTTFVPPTHFIRFARHTTGLQLSLCWFTRNGETQVPAASVKWHRLAGNGAISAEGIFTPASSSPSPVTVLMAEDERDQTEWRYGVIIVPMPMFDTVGLLSLLED